MEVWGKEYLGLTAGETVECTDDFVIFDREKILDKGITITTSKGFLFIYEDKHWEFTSFEECDL